MTSRRETAINYTNIWLSESPIKWNEISPNSFLIYDCTYGVDSYEIELIITDTHVSFSSIIMGPLVGSQEGFLAIEDYCMRYNYKYAGPSLGMAEDGSIVASADYYIDEHGPKKMFSTLVSFEPIQKKAGADLLEIAVKYNMRFK